MTIDEDKIMEVVEDKAGEKLKEACVWTYCEVLDAIRLLEEKPLKARMVSMLLRRGPYGQLAEKYLPKLWARWEEAEAAAWRKADEEIAKMPWWKRWWWR